MTSSVVVALYNGEKYLIPQLDSIRDQTVCPDEVLLQDDASTDKTFIIVSNYIEANQLQGTWSIGKNVKNLGYSKNFHSMIMKSNSDIVFFSDQDDIWDINKIKIMTKIMENNEKIRLLSCRHCDFSDTLPDRNIKVDLSIKPVDIVGIVRRWNWPGMCMCVRVDWYKRAIKSESIKDCPHDLLMAIVAADTKGFYECTYRGSFHRIHEKNSSPSQKDISILTNADYKIDNYQREKQYLINILNSKIELKLETKNILEKKILYLGDRVNVAKKKSVSLAIKTFWNADKTVRKVSSLINDLYGIAFGK